MPVYLTYRGLPLCATHPGVPCQYPIRSLALDALLLLHRDQAELKIERGHCPHCAKKERT